MPFSRYLQSNERDNANVPDDDLDHPFSSHVGFQLPNLICNAPAIPPGGGAEALPAGLYPPPAASLSWFSTPEGYSSSFPPPASYHPPSSSSSSHSPTSVSLPPPFPNLPYPHPSPSDSHQPPFLPQLPLSIPSSLGLPIYSASGFDLLSLLSRVVNRPYPKIYLGPVDLSCSFVVTDTRRFDSPIVYASPSFLKLTGYDEREIVGHNCRFLQSPGGHLQRGQERHHTSRDAVAHMRKNIIADKECQVSIINYRKDGSAFINMVSVIPLRGGVNNAPDEADDIVYHIGFQVDLTEQPKSILTKLKDGTYVVNYSDKPFSSHSVPPSRDWRTSSLSMRGMSKDLRALLSDSAFTASFQLSTSTHASTAIALSNSSLEPAALDPYDGNKPLHMFLLDRSPDFLLVVSLKGAFLYVAPAVHALLGYDPSELVGRSLTDFCHPADCVPLMCELKEASATPGPSLLATTAPVASSQSSGTVGAAGGGAAAANSDNSLPTSSSSPSAPRPVDLLFRLQAKGREYLWIECRGRLHVEPGKGRKAIILSGRLRNIPHLQWGPISRAGGLVPPLYHVHGPSSPSVARTRTPEEDREERSCEREREFWGLLSNNATFLYVGTAVRDVLGWGAGEVIGKPLSDFVSGNSAQEVHLAIEVEITKVLADAGGSESSGLACDVRTKDGAGGTTVSVHVVFYRSRPPASPGSGIEALGNGGDPASQAPVVCQVKLCDPGSGIVPAAQPITHLLAESVFEETDIERPSSWQYELQQLKFRNQRLVEEVGALEAGLNKKLRRKESSRMSPPSTASASSGVGLGVTMGNSGGRSAPRMGMLSAANMHPGAHQQMNVRFVSGGAQVPRGPPSSRVAHHPGTTNSSPILSQPAHASASGMHPSVSMPYLPSQMQRAPGPGLAQHPAQRPAVQMSPSGSHPAMYAPGPPSQGQGLRQSTESSLQGWSAYFEQADPGGGGMGVPGYGNALPAKRTWDDSLRDSGGGGGGGGGGAA